jgi:hypothetical protein
MFTSIFILRYISFPIKKSIDFYVYPSNAKTTGTGNLKEACRRDAL